MNKKKLMDLKINLLLINNSIDEYNLSIYDFLSKYRNNYEYLLEYFYILFHLDDFVLIHDSICNNILEILNIIRLNSSNEYINELITEINIINNRDIDTKLDVSDIKISAFLNQLNDYIEENDFTIHEIKKIEAGLVKIDEFHDENEYLRLDQILLFRKLNQMIYKKEFNKVSTKLNVKHKSKVYKKGM